MTSSISSSVLRSSARAKACQDPSGRACYQRKQTGVAPTFHHTGSRTEHHPPLGTRRTTRQTRKRIGLGTRDSQATLRRTPAKPLLEGHKRNQGTDSTHRKGLIATCGTGHRTEHRATLSIAQANSAMLVEARRVVARATVLLAIASIVPPVGCDNQATVVVTKPHLRSHTQRGRAKTESGVNQQ